MAFNGSGIFARLYSWANDRAANIKMRADRMDNEMDGFATGLSSCLTKDGQTTVTANLPMASYRHTSVGNSSGRDQYAATGQVQDGKFNWVAAGGTVDAITATYSPVIAAIVDGQECFIRTTGTNVTTTPTFAPNGLTARTIVKNGGGELLANEIPYEAHLRYNLANTRWELLNPLFVGGTLTAKLNTLASATGGAGLNAPHGAAPTTPANGDVWTTTAGVFARVNGATQQLDVVDNTAWSTSSPTVTALSGTFTTVAAAVRYKQIGETVFFSCKVTVTTNGTAAGDVRVPLPVTAYSDSAMAGRNTATGVSLTGDISTATAGLDTLQIKTYNNQYPAADGAILVINGVYEAA